MAISRKLSRRLSRQPTRKLTSINVPVSPMSTLQLNSQPLAINGQQLTLPS